MYIAIFDITLINSRYFADNMNEEHVARFFVKASKTLNLRVSAHRFRHAFATKLANNTKTNIKTVYNKFLALLMSSISGCT
jgi:integrase